MNEHIVGPGKVDFARPDARKALAIADVIFHSVETGKTAPVIFEAIWRELDENRPAASRKDFGCPAPMPRTNFQHRGAGRDPGRKQMLHHSSLPFGVGDPAELRLPLPFVSILGPRVLGIPDSPIGFAGVAHRAARGDPTRGLTRGV